MIENIEYLKAYVSQLIVSGNFLQFDDDALLCDVEVTRQDVGDGGGEKWLFLYGSELNLDIQKMINTHHELRIFDSADLLKIVTFLDGKQSQLLGNDIVGPISDCAVCSYPTISEPWDFCVICGWQDGVNDNHGRSTSNRDRDGKSMTLSTARQYWSDHANIRGDAQKTLADNNMQFWRCVMDSIRQRKMS